MSDAKRVLSRLREGSELVQERKTTDVLEVMEPLEPCMTSEIAKELGWSQQTAYEVLKGLAEEEEIRKKLRKTPII